MSIVLEDVWLPEVEAEYCTLLKVNPLLKVTRDVAADVGKSISRIYEDLAALGGEGLAVD
jgi:hypothetical protein